MFINLPNLHKICPGIDFQTVASRQVKACPNISLTSTDNMLVDRYYDWLENSEINEGKFGEYDFIDHAVEREMEASKRVQGRDRSRAEQSNISPDLLNIKETAEASNEINDSEQTNKPAPFAGPSQIESPQSERERHLLSQDSQSKSSDSSSNTASSQETAKPANAHEGSKSDEAIKPNQIMIPESSKSSPTAFVVPPDKEYPHDNLVCQEGKGKKITLDQQALTKTESDMHPDDSQKIIEASVTETSNKIAMAISSTATGTSSSLIP
ncbi:uncharacterized protein LOC129284760 isoform X1 [Prosopis cineraria]|uniref:uncharacterized protein LOC129284760 isoform X1 n=1 Tax=Prosopis cineraria TaxID=364024 RepID=UPI00240FD3B8|nr:uncharacterized protein LOC129284760 isoform X1 [Prosopis cineraria]